MPSVDDREESGVDELPDLRVLEVHRAALVQIPIEDVGVRLSRTPPTPLAQMFMNVRRVTVSPSNAPGIFRSAVYFGLGCL